MAKPTWWVAFSGGPDSWALLDFAQAHHPHIGVIHVNHGWSAASTSWAERCRAEAIRRGLPVHILSLDPSTPKTEAAARDARYALMADYLAEGDRLLVGHHRDDQRETRVMRALQGRAPRGMPAMRPLGRGVLWRPLLDHAKPPPHPHAIVDPANSDLRFRRVAVRMTLLPRLDRADIDRVERLGRLIERIDRLVVDALPQGDRLPLSVASPASIAAWCWRAGHIPAPPQARIDTLLMQLPPAPDRQPAIEWNALGRRWSIRAYAGELWLFPLLVNWPQPKPDWQALPPGQGGRLHRLGIPPWERGQLWQDGAGQVRGWRPKIGPQGQISLEELRLND